MRRLWRFIERSGFLIFLMACATTALGVMRSVRVVWLGGLLVVVSIVATVFIHATRAAFGPPRHTPPPTGDEPSPPTRADKV